MPATCATPLPLGDIAAVMATQFCESYQANVLFPFVGTSVGAVQACGIASYQFRPHPCPPSPRLPPPVFMVHSFRVSPTDAGEGYYVGALTAAFFFGQFISSSVWV